MDSTIQNNKKMIFPSPGVDQLGTQVGQAMPGDLVKFHMVASYSAMRPKFKIAGKKFGAERMRTEEFFLPQTITVIVRYLLPSPSSNLPT